MIPVVVKSIRRPGSDDRKFYVQVAPTVPLNLESIATNISARCTVTETDCLAVLSALEAEVITALLNGNSVRLGQLGSFRPTVTSAGASKRENATTDMVTTVRARFTAGARLRKALDPALGRAKFIMRTSSGLADKEEFA